MKASLILRGLQNSAKQSRRLALLTCTISSIGIPAQAGQFDSCFEFFQNLPIGDTGSCADVVFFGFTGIDSGIFECTSGGTGMAEIDLFDDPELAELDFFDPNNPVFASVNVVSEGTTGLTEFSIQHRSSITMFPLSEMPPAGTDASRFISTSSQNKTVFTAEDPTPGIQDIDIEIELEQDFEFIDPIDNGVSGDLGTFFLIDAVDLDLDEELEELIGTSFFDSDIDPEPNFVDEFAPGYDGFTTTTSTAPGQTKVEFKRTINFTVKEGNDIEMESLASQHIFADGFESGNTSAWTMSSPDTFTFKVTSPNPNVRFNLNLDVTPPQLVVPVIDVAQIVGNQVRLTWEALNTQTYTILFTTDLSLPQNQWQERGTVTGTAGAVSRDLDITNPGGFFAIRVTSP